MKKENGYLQLFFTLFITGAAFFINYGINMVLVPFISGRIGEEAYGFVSLSKEFAQYAALLTAAINSFAARYIAVAYHNDRIKEANVYYSSVFYGDLFIGTVIFLAAGLLILNLQHFLQIPENLVTDVKIMFFIIFLDFWVITVFTAFSCAAYVENKLHVTNLFKGIGYVAEAAVLIILYLLLSPKLFYVGIGILACTVISVMADVGISRKYTPGLCISWKYFSLAAVKRLIFDGVWTSVSSVGKILNQGLDLVICNLMLGSLPMSQLAVAKTIDSIAHAMYMYLAQAFHPLFLKAYAEEDKTELIRELRFSMKVCGLFSNLVAAGFFGVGLAFCEIWIPDQNCELIYRLTVLTLLTGFFVGPLSPLYYIYVLTVKRAFPSVVICIGGLLNVSGMYVLIRFTGLGIYSIVLTTTVIEAVIGYVTNPLYMTHVLHVPWYTFYPGLVRNLVSGLAMAFSFYVLSGLYKPEGWLSLICVILIYVLIGTVIHVIIVCSGEDRHRLTAFLKRRIKR